jgi:hypothetical protein
MPTATKATVQLPRRIEELRSRLVARIPCNPNSAEVQAELDAQSFDALLRIYLNWQQRLVPARPREVFFAPNFWDDSRATTHASAIFALLNKVRTGVDLTPHLSHRVHTHGYVPERYTEQGERIGPEWGDKDFALNAWDTHHLHLVEASPRGKRRRASDELLYATFTRRSAHFLMVGDHRSFDDGALEAAMITSRAASGDWVLRGILGGQDRFSDEERRVLARRGFTTHASVGNQVVMSAVLSTAGTSLVVGRHADRTCLALNRYDPRLDDPDFVVSVFASHGRQTKDLRLYWEFDHCDLVLVDAATQRREMIAPGWL